MAGFMIRFIICNLFVSVLVGILLSARRILGNILSRRMQCRLWFLWLIMLIIPFLPFRLTGFSGLHARLEALSWLAISDTGSIAAQESAALAKDMGWLNDFTLSVSSKAPPITGSILLGIWLLGILIMVLLTVRSALHLQNIKQSALPLQNPAIRRLYRRCLDELHITKEIPIYSTAFLKSPAITGFLMPRIYLPLHIISDYSEEEAAVCRISGNSHTGRMDGLPPVRYMLLHELQHYKHKDTLTDYLTALAGILYWFNPMVWIGLKEMRNDREIACDTSVLKMLEPDSYEDYGKTLIHFAEKLSRPDFPFAAGLSGNMAQMKRRVANIASYEKPTLRKRLAGMAAFLMVALLLLGFAPLLSAGAASDNYDRWDTARKNISAIDLSSYFNEYEGSFVLYDMGQDTWSIYDMERAALRVSPDSTYKIYDALFGLESGVITPEDSFMEWDGRLYSFQEWNAGQTLRSAMQSSVNWYFQEIDKQLGASAIGNYIRKIGYGNENTDSSLSTYWMESSLKISPIEQVELLQKLYKNGLGFRWENTQTVKDSLLLSSSETGSLYGKTGTGCVDGMDVNGWFVGYVETNHNSWFFAANIAANDGAKGSEAAKITMSILSQMDIWK